MKAKIISFNPIEDGGALDAYLKGKYSVFYSEFGWKSFAVDKTSRIATLDNFDLKSNFVCAVVNSMPAGFLRITDIKYGLPHSCLFERHMSLLERNKTASLNALFVNKEYRGKYYSVNSKQAKLGSAMLSFALSGLRSEGYEIVVTSTSSSLAKKAFLPLGFVVVDQDVKYKNVPDLVSNLFLFLNGCSTAGD